MQTNLTNETNPPKEKAGITIGRWQFIALGAALCACTLAGMLAVGLSAFGFVVNVALDYRVNELQERVDRQDRQAWIASNAYFECGTDFFYVQRALFTDEKTVTLDLDVQASHDEQYTGDGKFSLSDDALKQEVRKMADEFTGMYGENRMDAMPGPDELTVDVCVYGWRIAQVKGGEVTLTEAE